MNGNKGGDVESTNFDWVDHLGRSLNRDDFSEQKVYISFVRATTCVFCNVHVPNLLKLSATLGSENKSS